MFQKWKTLRTLNKITALYEKVFHMKIPESQPELEQLKQLELDDLRIAFDALRGWEYKDIKVPATSLGYPKIEVLPKTINKLQELKRHLDYKVFVDNTNFVVYPPFNSNRRLVQNTGEYLWKQPYLNVK